MIDDFIKYIIKKNKLLGLILAGIVVISFLIDVVDKFIKLGQLSFNPWWLPFFIILCILIGVTISREKQGAYTKRVRIAAKLFVVICCQLLIFFAWFYFGQNLIPYNNKSRLGFGLFIVFGLITIFVFERTHKKAKNYKVVFCEFSEAASEDIPKDRHITYYVLKELQERFERTNVTIEKLDEVVIEDSRAQTLGINAEAVAVIYGIYTKVQSNIKLDLRFLVIRRPEYYQPIDLNKKILPMEELDAGKLETLIGNDFANITNFLIGLFEYSRGNFKDSIETFTSLTNEMNKEKGFNSLKAEAIYLYLGNSYYLLGDTENSKKNYKQALILNPDYTKAIHNIGVIDYQKGNFDDAIRSFTRALSLDSQFGIAYRNRAFVLILQKKYQQALDNLLIYISSKPLDPDAHKLAAICYSNIGNHTVAITEFKLAEKIVHHDINIALDLADEYIAINNFPKAFAIAFCYLYQVNQYSKIFGYWGDVFMELNHRSLADTFYTIALFFDHKKYFLLFSRSKVRLVSGNQSLAIKDLEKVIELEPRMIDAYFNLSNIYMRQRDFVTASKIFSQGISISPNYPDLYFGRAQANLVLQRYQEVVDDCENYLQLTKSENLKIYELLGLSFCGLSIYDKAIDYLYDVYEKSPSERNKSNLEKARRAYHSNLSISRKD